MSLRCLRCLPISRRIARVTCVYGGTREKSAKSAEEYCGTKNLRFSIGARLLSPEKASLASLFSQSVSPKAQPIDSTCTTPNRVPDLCVAYQAEPQLWWLRTIPAVLS